MLTCRIRIPLVYTFQGVSLEDVGAERIELSTSRFRTVRATDAPRPAIKRNYTLDLSKQMYDPSQKIGPGIMIFSIPDI